MELIRASQKRQYGNDMFHIEILFPGKDLGLKDTGFRTIGRIDHANFKPPGIIPMHPHRDDEILSYMRSGVMKHKDNTDYEKLLDAFTMMTMNAGSGLQHEESAQEDLEMLQIFMRPFENGLEPKVQFHKFENLYSQDQWRLIAGNSEAAPLELRTDTNIFDTRLSEGGSLHIPMPAEKAVHLLYCFNGIITIGDLTLNKGDCVIFDEELIHIKAAGTSDLVLFEIKEGATYSDTGMFSSNQFRANPSSEHS
jgi:redox-sensitive bicupin YhaK (pirin superfamily)